MRGLIKAIIFFLLGLVPAISLSGQPTPIAMQEITFLIKHMKESGCEFKRNGTWYRADEAVEHINKKYYYLLKRGLVSNAEEFIERVASESSMSGRPYQVKCGNDASVNSAAWLSAELVKYRKQTRTAK